MPNARSIGVPVSHLRPTQITVGLREVEHKRQQWRKAGNNRRANLLRCHVFPAVIGPKQRPYIIDHHHFSRALLEENAGTVGVYILADLSHLPKRNFWTHLDNRGWCHAYDERGKRRKLDDIPKRLVGLADDPFRSLAGALIRGGSCAKSSQPFSEFLWADYLRHRIELSDVTEDYDRAVSLASKLAKENEAKALPGWCGDTEGGL